LSFCRILCLVGFFLVGFFEKTYGQSDPALLYHFSFDSCSLRDQQRKATPSSVGPIACTCGVQSDAFEWNGGLHFASWDGPGLANFFVNDFTVSFYFKPDRSVSGVMDILSKRSNCGIDSFFAIRYLSDNHVISAEIIGRVDNIGSLNAKLPENRCWHFISFTKSGQRLTLYINGVQRATKINNYTITVQNDGKLAVANSPCLGVSDIRYKGSLDELTLYTRALRADEIRSQYVETDLLLTQDTILLKGQSVQIRTLPTCANRFQWSPISGVQNSSQANTRISPSQSTTYYLQSTQGSCTVRDSVRITVVDATTLDCNAIQLPNAFTPNGDGLNDVFRISNPYVVPDLQSFEIFDRWGAKLFSGDQSRAAWDGTFRNQLSLAGLYVYHIKYKCNGEQKHKSGSFKLIR
jgi:gliding motility-associated-like protein